MLELMKEGRRVIDAWLDAIEYEANGVPMLHLADDPVETVPAVVLWATLEGVDDRGFPGVL